jgi:Chalcone isomerase-like
MSSSSRCAAPERRRLLCAAALVALAPAARAQVAPPPEVAQDLPGARLLGQGTLRWLGLRVYDAVLWSRAPLTAADAANAPLALELRYARRLKGPLIAERSLDEMRRQGPIDDDSARRWLAAMTGLFPDVDEGDRITGIQRPGVGARFHVNGRLVGELADAQFARRFFGIWLSDSTSEPALRSALLGARP